MERKKQSIGKFFHNKGIVREIKEERYKIDLTRDFYVFDVIPMGSVRMTQSDRWKTNPNHLDPNKRQRKSVTKHFTFKNEITRQGKLMNFNIGECLECVYFIPMPDSWSEKKKEKMNGFPCKVKPDCDNITKLVKDSFCINDSNIWNEEAKKVWAYNGSIIIFTSTTN